MSKNPLGEPSAYADQYSPDLLFAIAREEKRQLLARNTLSFTGEDIWNAYELSWLNLNGLPQVGIGEIRVPASSEFIFESKSLKLYFNSFNQTQFEDQSEVVAVIQQDLSQLVKAEVSFAIRSVNEITSSQIVPLEGLLIDSQDIQISSYQYNPKLLAGSQSDIKVSEVLVSHLLKSNCLITNQPDWASVQISYTGNQIDPSKLLAYLVSFRSHNEFHEQCVERIFSDLKTHTNVEKLTVYARYTRRGGIDINPWRSDFEKAKLNTRLARQ